ncbi:phage/plasmid primase, P4 family [Flavobacterium sp.]|uniref:DNA primase family protein n=1 Tax=Flavobacterium sp. TaxID=239 RepID=UPI00375319C9
MNASTPVNSLDGQSIATALKNEQKTPNAMRKCNKLPHSKSVVKKTLIENIEKCTKELVVSENSKSNILTGLLNSINPIDFEFLAFPDAEKDGKEIARLAAIIFDKNGDARPECKDELKRHNSLKSKLYKNKLTKNHYLIICIEQLMKIATENNWGLCKKNGYIYLYNGSYWEEIDKERFQFFLGDVAMKMDVEKFRGKVYTFKEDLFKQFLSDAYLPVPDTKKDSIMINLQNGTFDISSTKQVLRNFDSNDFLTHQLPFEYNPKATAPMFQKYLDEVLPDKEKQRALAEFCGYIFINSSHLKLEKMLILYGTGANGKSVFFEIINALLGSENISNYSLQSLTDDKGYSRAKIGNKLVNYASEINGKLETDVFKQMASGEPIEARLPYGEPFILNNYSKLVFNCNELPKDVEHTNAYFRRFMIIEFDQTIPEERQDKQLPNKIIENELAGVFNWILSGLDRVLENKGFSKCDAVDNARINYQKQSDSVLLFIEEHGYKVSPTERILISDLYPLYKTFCMDDGYKALGKKNFIQRLNHFRMYVQRITIGNVVYLTND